MQRRFWIKTGKVLIVTLLMLTAFGSSELKAADWRALTDFRGAWLFTVGDDPAWARPETDTGDWDRLNAPGDWERYYPGYNGYAWYRKTFNLKAIPKTKALTLFLGYIDDVDEVFINGQKVGQTGQFFPNYQTAYSVERRYVVPASLLKESGNVIAVRVYDEYQYGGIIRADRFGLYYDREQEMLRVDLSGNWKFSIDNFGDNHSVGLDDSGWDELFVPMSWESQGYPEYDGKAWYRKRFTMPTSLQGQDLFLVLGKIDDFDKVYLNGKLIGRVEELEQYSRFRRGNAYNLIRAYEIPKGLIKAKNLISVEVDDPMGVGGIYEGPVGIMTGDAARELLNKHRWSSSNNWNFSFWDLFRIVE
ncbi:glycoside hydrolase [Gaoshiqia sediminis]|uniref:Glycoside hydrolase n=1 Tax=Gaoshiqia sediminis TaxID=2986998 RepID=A0AA41Y960_9BACT|nr:glycoside hydrolase [Gaoshiqia sediminis]MCW0481510.1 glycoside hydrolase [Gaoshiqia sediminis]